jgi:hypothetical protein
MTDDRIRLDVLGRAAADLADIDLRTLDEKQRIVAELTDAERRLIAKASGALALSELEDAGVVKAGPTVLDATNRQLQAVAAVWGVLHRWDYSLNTDRRLGDQLKTLPAEDAQLVITFLRWGGILTEAPSPPAPNE